jgi:hypothetical protein
MFRDAPDSYKGNAFLEAVSKPIGISQLLYEGTCKQLDAMFYDGWSDKVAAKLNISKGLFLSCYLADLYASIQKVKSFKCFGKIADKLAKVDDSFIPTVFEVEMAEIILEIFKAKVTDIEFAGCFRTKGDKKIDLRAKLQDQWVYFEFTKIMDYRERNNILRLYNLASSFLVGAQMISGKNLELTLKFPSMPNQESIDNCINGISEFLNDKIFTFTIIKNETSFSLKETKDRPIVNLQIESETISNKLKDKYFKELEHFDGNEINIIVIDATYLPDDPKDLIGLTKTIFETEGNLSIISLVVLYCKKHAIEKDDFPITTFWEAPFVFNKKCEKSVFMKKILNFEQEE